MALHGYIQGLFTLERDIEFVKTTLENIQDAINGEHYEFTTMYPEMIKHAKEDGNKKALRSFEYANEVEKIHEKLYISALFSSKGGSDMMEKQIWVCPVCGMTMEGDAPDVCPICNAKKDTFILIE